jgi:hypothetical protein
MALPDQYGFIILRHVDSIVTNEYWKRCYHNIRTYFPTNPIMIVDDNSNREFLTEDDVDFSDVIIVYSKTYKGAAEFLPYYYFHKLQPFPIAVIIHDSVFIHSAIPFSLRDDEPIRFVWTIPHLWDEDALPFLEEITEGMPHRDRLLATYKHKDWWGSFGAMSIIRWSFLNQMNQDHRLFQQISRIKTRDHRSAWERLLGLLAYEYVPYGMQFAQFRNINHYLKMGITYEEYCSHKYDIFPIVKVWTGR